jgi:hypothetical protein
MTGQAGWLMACLLVGHFLGDFTPLATARMQKAKAAAKPMWPIAAHAAVHAVLAGLAIGLVAVPGLQLLGMAVAIQFVSHFVIDAVRARISRDSKVLRDVSRGAFWRFLGFDQLLHGLVLVGLAVLVL